MSEIPVDVKKIEMEENDEAKKLFEEYFKSINPGYIKKGFRKILK